MFDEIPHLTTRIEAKSGTSRSYGTGFYFFFDVEGKGQLPAVVTNKHVLEGAEHITINISLESDFNGYRHFLPVDINNIQNSIYRHPDEGVDISVFPIGHILNSLGKMDAKLKLRALGSHNIPTDAEISTFTAVEEILMVGYPTGLWDKSNNFPIVRRGITATPYAVEYEGRSEFMIDAACFPGSSGSPIILANQGSYAAKEGGIVIGSRFHLLGLLWGGPQFTAEGSIITKPVPTSSMPVSLSRIPTNLGFCIKAKKILDLVPVLSHL